MKKLSLALPFILGLSLLYSSCGEPEAAGPGTGGGVSPFTTATITGRVIENQTSIPLSGALVNLSQSTKNVNLNDTTAADGTYGFVVDLGDTIPISGTLTVTKSGYRRAISSVTMQGGTTTAAPDIGVDRDTTVFIGGAGTTYPNTIALIGASLTEISVYGVGGMETAIITYEVRDSLGFPIDINHQDTVVFGVNPSYLAHSLPLATLTNAAGRVATTLSSDTIAGAVQLVARLRRDTDGRIIQSEPVRVVIHSGLPDQAHFTMGAVQLNFAAYDWMARTNTVRVLVGDRYSNPVQPGTAVYFSTTGGIIQAAGFTAGGSGLASVTLFSGNPLPFANLDPLVYPPSLFGTGQGYAWVRSSTIGLGGAPVGDSLLMLFSAQAQITYRVNGTDTTQVCFIAGSSQSVSVKVSDRFGNPLSAGTSFSASLEVTADSTVVIDVRGVPEEGFDDFITRGPGRTDFTLTVFDATPMGAGSNAQFTLSLRVTGLNGSAFVDIPGRLRLAADPPCP